MSSIRELIKRALDGDKRARFAVFGVAGALALAAAYLLSGSDQGSTKTIPLKSSTGDSSPAVVDSSIWVDIVGSIEAPGVYSLKPGSRVFELVALAGGFTRDADQSSVNLARNLTDGEQIRVLNRSVGQLDSPQSSLANSLISINAASAATLETLPGVGPKLAARIVDWRSANSGFQKITDLRKVGGIGDKLFASIKDLVSL